MAVNSVCFKIARESRLFCQLIAHVGLQIPCNLALSPVKSGHLSGCASAIYLGPPDPTVIAHIKKVSYMTFTHMMRVIFSLISQTCVAQFVALGRTQSKFLTSSKPSDILWVLGIPCYRTKTVTFLHFTAFLCPGALGLSFTKGDALRYAIIRNHPRFLN